MPRAAPKREARQWAWELQRFRRYTSRVYVPTVQIYSINECVLCECQCGGCPLSMHMKDQPNQPNQPTKPNQPNQTKPFFFASAFRPVWPGRCIVLSLSLCTTSRLAPWTRGGRTAASCQRQARKPWGGNTTTPQRQLNQTKPNQTKPTKPIQTNQTKPTKTTKPQTTNAKQQTPNPKQQPSNNKQQTTNNKFGSSLNNIHCRGLRIRPSADAQKLRLTASRGSTPPWSRARVGCGTQTKPQMQRPGHTGRRRSQQKKKRRRQKKHRHGWNASLLGPNRRSP